MQNKNRHHFYNFPELLGQALVLVVLVTAITGVFRLVEVILPIDQSAVAQTEAKQSITSVSDYLHFGYLKNNEGLDALPTPIVVEQASAEPSLALSPEPKVI